ncbi:MAG: CsbD family protein [Methylobacter sp.]
MNKDQVKGRVEEGKGKVKEVAGKIMNDEEMEAKGKIQKNVGKGQAGYGDVKEDVKDKMKKGH